MVSLWHVATGRRPAWQTVLDVQQRDDTLHVVVGAATYELSPAEWPEHAALASTFRAAEWNPA